MNEADEALDRRPDPALANISARLLDEVMRLYVHLIRWAESP
ncbi:hypothetical protein [Streptomyces sp. NPDC005795]